MVNAGSVWSHARILSIIIIASIHVLLSVVNPNPCVKLCANVSADEVVPNKSNPRPPAPGSTWTIWIHWLLAFVYSCVCSHCLLQSTSLGKKVAFQIQYTKHYNCAAWLV